jgi:hypothetical protein
VKWRTGSEGRISSLKRSYGWNRTLLDDVGGAGTWCGLGVLAHNAVKIAGLIGDHDDARASRIPHQPTSSRPQPAATGLPGSAPSMSAP